MKLKSLLFLLMLVLISSIAYARVDYPLVGGRDQDFNLGLNNDSRGKWNELKGDDFSKVSAPISSPRFIPFVEDLDGDGVNEIIIIDDSFCAWLLIRVESLAFVCVFVNISC